jgi:vanillate O-demethylase monooxygenase subunit
MQTTVDSPTAANAGHYARNVWYVAFWSSDLETGVLRSRTILGEPIVFFRNASGEVTALEDMCPHRFAPLSIGKMVDGDRLQCGYHGLTYDRAGVCVFNPHGDHKIPPAARVRPYPVVEKHSIVWIWMGEAAPNAAAIPDYSQIDGVDEIYISKRDHMMIDADYRLITDNLIDLSHVPFLHGGLLGDEKSVVSDVTVTQDGTTVTQSRWSYDVPVATMFDMLFRGDGKPIDSWLIMHWRPAGNMILDVGVCEPGAPKESGTGYYGVHILTPETPTTTHYHFVAVRFNPVARTRDEDLALREKITEGRRYAFEIQDKPVLEAQQRRVDGIGAGRRPALLSVDAGPVRAQKVLTSIIAADATVGAHAAGRG